MVQPPKTPEPGAPGVPPGGLCALSCFSSVLNADGTALELSPRHLTERLVMTTMEDLLCRSQPYRAGLLQWGFCALWVQLLSMSLVEVFVWWSKASHSVHWFWDLVSADYHLCPAREYQAWAMAPSCAGRRYAWKTPICEPRLAALMPYLDLLSKEYGIGRSQMLLV